MNLDEQKQDLIARIGESSLGRLITGIDSLCDDEAISTEELRDVVDYYCEMQD